MRRILFAAAIALLATALPNPASAQAIVQIVDCAKGQTIMAAVNRVDDRKPLVVVVRGTCTESVVIKRNWVTLQGDPAAGDTIVAPSRDRGVYAIEVTGTSIAVNGLTVKGGYHCIFANPQSQVTVADSTIQDCASGAFFLYNGAAHITNSTIETSGSGVQVNYGGLLTIAGSQVRDNSGVGIAVTRNSVASVSDCTISNNGGVGVNVNSGGQVNLSTSTITANKKQGVMLVNGGNASLTGNTITANGAITPSVMNGVEVYRSDLDGSGNHINSNIGGGVSAMSSNVSFTGGEIEENGDNGVIALFGSAVTLHHINIRNNGRNGVSLGLHVTAWVFAANIMENGAAGIFINRGTKLDLGPEMTYVTGNGDFGLLCTDQESSYGGPLTGDISPGCTDYNNF